MAEAQAGEVGVVKADTLRRVSPTDSMDADERRMWDVAKAAYEAEHERGFPGGHFQQWDNLGPNQRHKYMCQAEDFMAMAVAAGLAKPPSKKQKAA